MKLISWSMYPLTRIIINHCYVYTRSRKNRSIIWTQKIIRRCFLSTTLTHWNQMTFYRFSLLFPKEYLIFVFILIWMNNIRDKDFQTDKREAALKFWFMNHLMILISFSKLINKIINIGVRRSTLSRWLTDV